MSADIGNLRASRVRRSAKRGAFNSYAVCSEALCSLPLLRQHVLVFALGRRVVIADHRSQQSGIALGDRVFVHDFLGQTAQQHMSVDLPWLGPRKGLLVWYPTHRVGVPFVHVCHGWLLPFLGGVFIFSKRGGIPATLI